MAKDRRKTDEEKRREGAERVYKGKSFEEKTGEIFKLMGFEVELNREIAGNEIDVFSKKKKSIGKKYEYYICECKYWNKKIGKNIVNKYSGVRDGVKAELKKQKKSSDCELIIISSVGFTENARKAADAHGIILSTYDELLSELMDFDGYLSSLIQAFKGSELDRLYIEQDFIPERSLEVINSFQFVKQWLKSTDKKQFSLLGDYGTGKTSFAQKLAYNMAADYKKDPGKGRIPFLVDLRQCQQTMSLKNLVHQQLINANIEPANEDIFLKLLAEGKILLIFDAFDEMATMSNADITLDNFRQLNQAVTGDAKVILTSRTHYFRDQYEVDRILKKQGVEGLSKTATALYREISGRPEYEIVYLKEFSDPQIKEYLQKGLKEGWKAAYEKILAIYNLYDLSSRPVLLDMIVKSLPKIEKGKEEFNVVHLYEVYTFSWFERDDHRLQITKEGREDLVEELAYRLWEEGKKSIHYSDLYDVLSEHLKLKIKSRKELEIADSEVRTASFLVRDAEGNYAFAHKSFQEFFIARKIKKELLEENTEILDLRRLSVEIIFFLRHLMENDDKIIGPMAQLLEKEYRENISENALFLFYTVIKMGFLKQRFSLNEDVKFSTEEIETFRKALQEYLPGQLNLRAALLNGLSLPNMVFIHTDFTESSVENAILTNALFEDVTFNKTGMEGTDFCYSVFKHVTFETVDAHGCSFKNCLFENCNFRESVFSMANFMDTTFENCIVEGNDFIGAGFLRSNMEPDTNRNNRIFGIGSTRSDILTFIPTPNLGHSFYVNSAVLSSDNRWMVSGSGDNTIKLWDVASGRVIKTFEGHTNQVRSVSLSVDNRRLVSGSDDNSVKLWDVEKGVLLKTFEGHTDRVNSVSLSVDNRRVVSGSYDNSVKLWDVEKGVLLKTFEGHTNRVNSVSLSVDNRRVVSGSDDNSVKLWDVEKGALLKTFEGHEYAVNSVFLSVDNRRVVSGSYDKSVKLWDVEKGVLLKTFEGHTDWVNSVSLSVDNRRLVSGSSDKSVKLWDVEKGVLLKTFEGHEGIVFSVFLSGDNRLMVSGSSDTTIKLWDVETGRLIKTFEGHTDYVQSVAISPDNRRIVSGSLDNTIKLWDIDTGKMIYSITLLPGSNAITFKDNTFFPSSDTALQWLNYTDGLALYPARDLPELRGDQEILP